MPTFSAIIALSGINPYVEVPARVSRSFDRRGHIPVEGRLNSVPIRSTLVSTGGGRHRLYINTDMRNRAGVGIGDKVELTVSFDDKPRKLPVPPMLTEALNKNKGAKSAYNSYTPSRKREILAYLNSLKKPESVRRNVDKLIKELSSKHKMT